MSLACRDIVGVRGIVLGGQGEGGGRAWGRPPSRLESARAWIAILSQLSLCTKQLKIYASAGDLIKRYPMKQEQLSSTDRFHWRASHIASLTADR